MGRSKEPRSPTSFSRTSRTSAPTETSSPARAQGLQDDCRRQGPRDRRGRAVRFASRSDKGRSASASERVVRMRASRKGSSERRSVLVATWDVHPVPEARLSELSTRLFSDYRVSVLPTEVVRPTTGRSRQLASFRFFDLRRDWPPSPAFCFWHQPSLSPAGCVCSVSSIPGRHDGRRARGPG
jgi:hypothetical protein